MGHKGKSKIERLKLEGTGRGTRWDSSETGKYYAVVYLSNSKTIPTTNTITLLISHSPFKGSHKCEAEQHVLYRVADKDIIQICLSEFHPDRMYYQIEK